MSDFDPNTDLLVPPRRLGALLANTRIDRGLSLAEAAEALNGGWGSLDLLEVEAGRRPVGDDELVALTSLYGIGTSDLVPQRSHLMIDMQERTLVAADRTIELGDGAISRREVLGRYLSLVCSMRGIEPGQQLTLRADDLEVLATLFGTSSDQIRIDLEEVIRSHAEMVDPWTRRLRGRVLVPALGVVVAATAFGSLLLVANDAPAGARSADPVGGGSPVATVEVEIGDAVVQERLPDGSPGPVVVRD